MARLKSASRCSNLRIVPSVVAFCQMEREVDTASSCHTGHSPGRWHIKPAFGAAFGVVVSVTINYRFDLSSLFTWLISIAIITGCGLLSLIHGDRFWTTIFGLSRRR
jgi:hypothetical protein